MDAERRRRIEELFEAAVEEPPHKRAWLLAEACGSDADLLREVEALLAGHDRVAGALERPVAGLAASLLDERLEQRLDDRRIGPYRVLHELGRGGMGVVYLAERDDGQYRRRVAIKLVRSGFDDGQIHRRFLAERQILASLNHPNIAQLLEGGVADGQLPYLVMEYVEGVPITAYCDKHRLSITARVRLFQQVCAAVHHAHQNLVIHRDLKPSNIVVDGQGNVKLLDFGIAKLLNPALGPAEAPFTRLAQWVMTPEYASPEQVRGEPLSTASDIYSLGVILYELLAGHRPYRFETGAPERVVELVCERDPDRPSTRAAQTEFVTAEDGTVREITSVQVSEARETSPDRLLKQLRGDLDAIVMMALRKEPQRRYESAAMLSQDLQRHLEGLPVQAHSGSRSYRARKFLRRHRVEAAAAALVAASLLAGAGMATWQAAVAGRERDRAEAALAQAEEVTDFLMDLFESGGPDEASSSQEVTARDLLRRGAANADELADQPAVHARMLDLIGRMHYSLGQYDDAQRMLERAVAIRRAAPGPGSLDLAESLLHLSWVHRSRSELGDARRLAEEVLAIRRRALPRDHPDLAEAVYEVGRVHRTEEQERYYREALAILDRADILPERRVSLLQGISTNLRRQGRVLEALETDREALRVAERELGPEHHQTGYAMIHLADHVRDTENDLDAAEQLYRRGLELLSRHYGDSHIRLIHGVGSLGTLHSRRGEHAEAERLHRRSMDIRIAAVGPDHPMVAFHLGPIATELERQGRLDEAEALAREAVERLARAFGARHPPSAPTKARLASILCRKGRIAEADSLYREAIDIRAAGQEAHSVGAAELRRSYGRLLVEQQRFDDAEMQLLESLRVLEREYRNGTHPNVQESKRALMELYQAWGRPELVERYQVPEGSFIPY